MRPGQNKRMRGRNNNNSGGNRKGPNPLTRSYESNGPDVKIRGNAHHVAEKYLQLARDAQSSGDPVAAESYLQHAEHYFRLIASAQQAQNGVQRPAEVADTDDDDGDDGIPDRFASPPVQPAYVAPAQPQPYAGERPAYGQSERQPYVPNDRQPYAGDRQPYADRQASSGDRVQQQGSDRGGHDRNGFVPRNDRQNYQDRNGAGRRPYRDNQERHADARGGDDRGGERFGRNQNRNGQDRGYDRNGHDRSQQERSFIPVSPEIARDPYAGEQPRIEPVERQPDPVVSEPVPGAASSIRRNEPVQQRPAAAGGDDAPGLPSFITMPTRTVPVEAEAPEPVAVSPTSFPGEDAGEPAKFPRRRRRPTRAAAAEASAEPTGSED